MCDPEPNNFNFLLGKNLNLSFSTWLTHLILRFLYILGCSGPRREAVVPGAARTSSFVQRTTHKRRVSPFRGLAGQRFSKMNNTIDSLNWFLQLHCWKYFSYSTYTYSRVTTVAESTNSFPIMSPTFQNVLISCVSEKQIWNKNDKLNFLLLKWTTCQNWCQMPKTFRGITWYQK